MKPGISQRFRRLRSNFSPSSLRTQLLSRSLIILAVLLLLIGTVQFIVMRTFLYSNQAEMLQSQIRGLPKELLGEDNWNIRNHLKNETGTVVIPPSASPPYDDRETGERRPFFFLPDTSIALVNADNELINPSSNESGLPAPQLASEQYSKIRKEWDSQNVKTYQIAHDQNGNEQLLVFRPADGPGDWELMIQMGISTAPLKAIAWRQLTIFIILSLIALGAGLMFYLPILRKTLTPLNQMVQTVEVLDAGKLDRRFDTSLGQSEIDRLAESFNGMLERLEISFENEREAKEHMQRFIADASHELRTPLTSIHGFLEVLLRGAAEKPEQLNAALGSMLGEAKRMKKLVEDLLILAKLDRTPAVSRSETSLDTLIEEMEPQLRMLAGERKIILSLAPHIRAMTDRDRIKQVILNLFHNAVQHTDPEKGAIYISLSIVEGAWAELRVKDNGPGIAPEHLPHVFERFYRSEVSRVRNRQGGAGLGLAITQSIVEVHGGQIEVRSATGEGATFIVKLPAL